MKRKVVRHGPSTLTISLPSKWCKKYEITADRELELIEESGNLIILNQGKKKDDFEIELNLENFGKIINDIIGACYKKGFNKLTIKYGSADELSLMHKVITKFPGYGITEEKANTLIVTELAELKEDKFEAILRRIFYYLDLIIEEGKKALENNDRDLLQKLVLRDRELTKLCDYIRRSINKKILVKEDLPLYTIVVQLEKIGDFYKYLFRHKLEDDLKLSKKFLKNYTVVKNSFTFFHELFYNYELKETKRFLEFKELYNNLILEQRNNKEAPYYTYLIQIMSTLSELKGAFLVLKLT